MSTAVANPPAPYYPEDMQLKKGQQHHDQRKSQEHQPQAQNRGSDEVRRVNEEQRRGQDELRRSHEEQRRGNEEQRRGHEEQHRGNEELRRGVEEHPRGNEEHHHGNEEQHRRGENQISPVQRAKKEAAHAAEMTIDKATETFTRVVKNPEHRRWMLYIFYFLWVSFPFSIVSAVWVYITGVTGLIALMAPQDLRGKIFSGIGLTWKYLADFHVHILRHLEFEQEKISLEDVGRVDSPSSFILYFGVVNLVMSIFAFSIFITMSTLSICTLGALFPLTGTLAKDFYNMQKKLAKDILFSA